MFNTDSQLKTLLEAVKPLADRYASLKTNFPNQLESHLVQVRTSQLAALAGVYTTIAADIAVPPLLELGEQGAQLYFHSDGSIEIVGFENAMEGWKVLKAEWSRWFADKVGNLRYTISASGTAWQKSDIADCNKTVIANWGSAEDFLDLLNRLNKEMENALLQQQHE